MRNPSAQFLRFGEHLAQAQEPVHAPTIAATLGVPASTLHVWLRQLRFQRVLLPQGRRDAVDQARLLQFFTALRTSRLSPVRTLASDLDARALSQRLQDERIPHALAMLSAANEWAFFEPRRRIELYAPRARLSDLSRTLADGSIPVDVFEENLAELPVLPRAGVPVTTAFLTTIDCRAHPEGGAHAHFLETNVLRRRAP